PTLWLRMRRGKVRYAASGSDLIGAISRNSYRPGSRAHGRPACTRVHDDATPRKIATLPAQTRSALAALSLRTDARAGVPQRLRGQRATPSRRVTTGDRPPLT